MTTRRSTLITLVSSSTLSAISLAQGTYPTKPISVIVPFAAGGNLDVVTRLVAVSMSRSLGQPFVVDNRVGAGGVIGHQAGSKALADGYTLTATANGSFAVTPRLQANSPFKSDDFIPVGTIAATPLVFEVPAGSRFRSMVELLQFARANPQQVNVGHSGNGTTNHVAILLLQEAAQVKFNIIPYKGSSPALSDLLGGQIDAMVDQLPSSLSHLQAGKLKALAVTSLARASDLPSIPTMNEIGLKEFDVSTITGMLVPAKTPDSVVLTLNRALNTALREPSVQLRLRELGSEPRSSTPVQFKTFLLQEERKAQMLVQRGLLKDE